MSDSITRKHVISSVKNTFKKELSKFRDDIEKIPKDRNISIDEIKKIHDNVINFSKNSRNDLESHYNKSKDLLITSGIFSNEMKEELERGLVEINSVMDKVIDKVTPSTQIITNYLKDKNGDVNFEEYKNIVTSFLNDVEKRFEDID